MANRRLPDTAFQRALASLSACHAGRCRVWALRVDQVWARHETVSDLLWLVAKVAERVHPVELEKFHGASLWTRVLHAAYCQKYDQRTNEQAMILDMLHRMPVKTVRDFTRPIIQVWARRLGLPRRMKGWRCRCSAPEVRR